MGWHSFSEGGLWRKSEKKAKTTDPSVSLKDEKKDEKRV